MATPLRPARPREYQLLNEAHRARSRGRTRDAMRIYRRLLVEHPSNHEVALRVAPMLACAGERFEAWQLYRRAATDFARARRWQDCLGVYREACRFVPGEFDAWRLCAELQLKLDHADGAFETLVEGRMHFRRPEQQGEAIALLTRAREIEPWDDDVLLDLAGLYAANDQADLALEMLSTLACRVEGVRRRRVRALQMRLTWSPRHAWLWLQAWLDRSMAPTPPPAPLEADGTVALDEVRERLRPVANA